MSRFNPCTDWYRKAFILEKERDAYKAVLEELIAVDSQWEFYEDCVVNAIKTLEKYNAPEDRLTQDMTPF